MNQILFCVAIFAIPAICLLTYIHFTRKFDDIQLDTLMIMAFIAIIPGINVLVLVALLFHVCNWNVNFKKVLLKKKGN